MQKNRNKSRGRTTAKSPGRVFRSYCYPIVQTRREKKRRGELKIDRWRPSPRDGESGAEIKRINSILLLNKKVLAGKPS